MPEPLLVIPFHAGDRGQVQRLGRWMRALSGGKQVGDRVLFVATNTTVTDGMGNDFRGLFREMRAIRQASGPQLHPGEPRWPKAPNFQFCSVVQFINDAYPDLEAFYYFEPDNLPLRADWWTAICEDYEKQGKPFYGAKSSYILHDPSGATWQDGEHMIGTGIYPRNVWNRLGSLREIERDEPNRPWDAITRDQVNPNCHFTDLIVHVHSCRGFRQDGKKLTAIYRGNLDKEQARREVVISPKAAVLHGCKDSSLRLILAKKLGIPQNDILTFCHAGDLGDIIWALPSIKALGGGILALSATGHAREPLTPARQAIIAPLIREQPYILDVVEYTGEYVDFDFRNFRALHKKDYNLVNDQVEWSGAIADTSTPWLETEEVKPNTLITINKTDRYESHDFPWARIVDGYGSKIRFLGTAEEHKRFCEEYGTVAYLPTPTLLDAAKAIKSSKLFIGNQSACNAIAEAMKHPKVLANCPDSRTDVFDNPKSLYVDGGNFDVSYIDSFFKQAVKKRDLVEA